MARRFTKALVLPVIVAAVALLGIVVDPTPAQADRQTHWRCWHNEHAMGAVDIWWGHTPTDAAWACNQWISECGNASGGCTATEL